MNKIKTLFLSIILGLTAAAITIAFTGPGSLTPGTGNPDFWIKSGSDVYYNPAGGGNVGIGKTPGSYALDINGNVNATAYYGSGANLTGLPSSGVAADGSVNPDNVLSNGDFENWSAGTSAGPDGWVLYYGGIARESTIIKSGTYSAKISGASAGVLQDVHAGRGINYWKGRTVTMSCWVYSAYSTGVVLTIWDGPGQTSSSLHPGDSAWHLLTVTRAISSSATAVELYAQVNTAGTFAYFDGCMAVEGSSVFAFSPKPPEEGVFASYSNITTVVGVSSPNTNVWTKKIGKKVFVNFYITGTGNNTAFTFTVPYAAASAPTEQWGSFMALNNGSAGNGRLYIAANASTIILFPDFAMSNWAAAGNTQVIGEFFYEAAN